MLSGKSISIKNTTLLNSEIDVGIRQRAWVEVDLDAIAENIRQIKGLLSPQTKLMAVVKADAYGHGAVSVAKTVFQAGAEWLAVATLPEGIELREAGIKQPILLLGAIHTAEEVQAIAHWQLQPTLCTPQQALLFSETLNQLNQSLAVQIKIDTGMSRLGTPWQQGLEFFKLVQRLPNLELAGIYSHFATADSRDPTVMRQQHYRYENVINEIRDHWQSDADPQFPLLHIANSAATLADRNLHYDMVRIGLSVYGLYPATHLTSVVTLKPAMQIKARVTQVKTIEAGTGVSYGYQFIAKKQTKIAVIGIGYADGIPRNLSNKIKVLIRGQWVNQIGTITMDQIMLDVSEIPDLQVGEVVTLLGEDGEYSISADDWANTIGTISWEILCGFKHRLPRVNIMNK
ncbi:alanine racemase [Planktothrix agardhii]|jgi:alanine racemase|uniref:Alanine racemase n=2 Tax=Planktothrix agardhii TaxID=1160 RepID=A0A073CTZ2_PLAA1|nr:alanine racemase [Planktothrix agardhii]KEI67475.1 Alr [Planktothrix agardhii NIVA-CYA 126/8]MBG0745929.1 alanine racemase [Planktothrix agardhii KL2]MCB8750964.1 alanine racemase [Planktothrix agardhii 1810]MCB8764536.1 alanine racemase [Planktothrix agardhii 1809]MCB8766218.1 alanine racemase [Planktothrix agardhii 1809]